MIFFLSAELGTSDFKYEDGVWYEYDYKNPGWYARPNRHVPPTLLASASVSMEYKGKTYTRMAEASWEVSQEGALPYSEYVSLLELNSISEGLSDLAEFLWQQVVQQTLSSE